METIQSYLFMNYMMHTAGTQISMVVQLKSFYQTTERSAFKYMGLPLEDSFKESLVSTSSSDIPPLNIVVVATLPWWLLPYSLLEMKAQLPL